MDRFQVERVGTPEYLRLEKQGATDQGKEFLFSFADRFPGIDLRGEISVQLSLKEVKPGLPERFTFTVPVSGILSD